MEVFWEAFERAPSLTAYRRLVTAVRVEHSRKRNLRKLMDPHDW